MFLSSKERGRVFSVRTQQSKLAAVAEAGAGADFPRRPVLHVGLLSRAPQPTAEELRTAPPGT